MSDDQKVGHGRFDPYPGKLEKTGLEGITTQAKEISRLRNRLAQIERQVRELADEIGNAAKYEAYHNREGNAFMLRYWGDRVRALIDPPEDT